ncbi:MAG: DUF3368 domain-containing protein [Chitinophagales bacterium]
MVIISDTSTVSNLIQIGELDLLKKMFGSIIIPPFVNKEIRALETFNIDIEAYRKANWITINFPKNKEGLSVLLNVLDRGESEAIILAQEMNAEYLLIDEKIGTRIAKDYGLNTIGLLGVLIKCKEKGFIDKVRPIIDKLRNDAGFWLSDKLYNRILQEIDEKYQQ